MKERMKALKESLANVQDRYRDSGDTELLVILDTLQLTQWISGGHRR